MKLKQFIQQVLNRCVKSFNKFGKMIINRAGITYILNWADLFLANTKLSDVTNAYLLQI